MMTIRAQWPHSIDDVYKSLDGIWGLVGASGTNGNLYRLERSLKEPVSYTVTEYNGNDESDVIKKSSYTADKRDDAVKDFARSIGFVV